MKKLLAPISCFFGVLVLVAAFNGSPTPKLSTPTTNPPLQKDVGVEPRLPKITTQIPNYQNYGEIIGQLKKWNEEAPDFTEVGAYGKTSNGKDIYYIRVTNKLSKKEKKKVLITACIHGNEPHSTSTVMAFIGTMLGTYRQDNEATEALDTRDVYFVPVVSPDSYPNSRHVDGVDPNRDFPGLNDLSHKSVPPVRAVSDFMLKHRFQAVISGHTHGRMYLIPYGDKIEQCPHHQEYQRIVGKMSQMSQYQLIKASSIYNRPILGSDLDFYYKHSSFCGGQSGGKGAFTIVMEMGTHQNIPSKKEIEQEFSRTYRSVLYFIKEAPLVDISW